ncbi:MAG: hypothetical protein JXQ85_06920 [Cognatishimia sp.]|uniref:hypothetical protein n=1 Tax=Cognatishimia sp. TaxID=2211648 RepID=UPI003B8B06F1
MTMEENLRNFMQDYHNVLNSKKYEGLAEFLVFPFEIALKGTTLRLNTLDEAIEAFQAVDQVHDLRGVAYVLQNVYLVHATSLSEAIIGTDETAYDAAGNELVNWHSSYLMNRINSIWRLTHANAINYDEAWENRGALVLHAAAESSLC